jgi:hypothetical protein
MHRKWPEKRYFQLFIFKAVSDETMLFSLEPITRGYGPKPLTTARIELLYFQLLTVTWLLHWNRTYCTPLATRLLWQHIYFYSIQQHRYSITSSLYCQGFIYRQGLQICIWPGVNIGPKIIFVLPLPLQKLNIFLFSNTEYFHSILLYFLPLFWSFWIYFTP